MYSKRVKKGIALVISMAMAVTTLGMGTVGVYAESKPGDANQYNVDASIDNYNQGDSDTYIATVGKWRADNSKSDKDTYFVNGEALSDDDIIISNGKVGVVLAVGTRNPWGYPAGSVLDAGYFKGGQPARDTVWSIEFLMNGWDSWAPDNCGTVNFELVDYDFNAGSEKGTETEKAVKVTRKYTQRENCDIDVVTYYGASANDQFVKMNDTVINNGNTVKMNSRTRFAETNKGDDGGAMMALPTQRGVMCYGNETTNGKNPFATVFTAPESLIQKDGDTAIDFNKIGGSVGYKEVRYNATYAAGTTTTYHEFISISDKPDTSALQEVTNAVANGEFEAKATANTNLDEEVVDPDKTLEPENVEEAASVEDPAAKDDGEAAEDPAAKDDGEAAEDPTAKDDGEAADESAAEEPAANEDSAIKPQAVENDDDALAPAGVDAAEMMTITGKSAANAAVILLDSKGTYGFYQADGSGNFSIKVPKGEYSAYAEAKDCAKGSKQTINADSCTGLTLNPGKTKDDITIYITDQNDEDLWGKVEFVGEYPTVRYMGDSVYQAHKKGKIKAKVGDIENFKARVYGEGYFFYSKARTITDSKVKPGNYVDVVIQKPVKNPKGWMSADIHNHGNKNDGFAKPTDLVPSMLASGLDVGFVTDHDFTVNNKETYDLINDTYGGEMDGFLPSEEISCSWAHFNVIPQTSESYDNFLDTGKNNYVMNQFSKFPEFVDQTHEAGATITANHPWYTYGLFYSSMNGKTPGGYNDNYDTVEINACSDDYENAATVISMTNLWSGKLTNGKYLGESVKKAHYLVGGSDTHDVLIEGVNNDSGDANLGGNARGESLHYNTGKARTYVKTASKDSVKDTGLEFAKGVAAGNSYVSLGPVLNLDKAPGEGSEKAVANGKLTVNMDLQSLADVRNVFVLTSDSKDKWDGKTVNNDGKQVGQFSCDAASEALNANTNATPVNKDAQNGKEYIQYTKSLSYGENGAKELAENGKYKIEVPQAPVAKWAAIMVVDSNGNYAITNPYWIPAKKVSGTSITSVKGAKKAFTVKWKKSSSANATGYQVRYSTKSSMSKAKTVTVGSYKTTSKKISKLSAKKKYYVQVRTYKTYNGKKYYSSWSSKKSVKTK